ncbi:MAG: CPBP family intramembrane metalloprotease, partial [Lachnospiraceae bacterium]|nr:CPBP family intramembrane metalloprotease [Lachnospiraceae bacterium]
IYMYKKDARRIIVPEPVSSPIGYAVLAVLGVSATIFLNFFLDLTGMIKLLGSTYENSARLIYSAPFIEQIIVAAVLGPAMEELLFRGLIFKRMRTYAIVPLAVLVSAIFFGLYHLNLLQFIYAGLLGLIFAYTYEKFHSIIACIIVHGCGNGISVVLQNNDGMSYMLAGDKTRTIITTVVTGILTLICLMVVARIKDKPVRDKQEVFTEETL